MSEYQFNISELFTAAFGLGRGKLPIRYDLPQEIPGSVSNFIISDEGTTNSLIRFDLPVVDNLNDANELSSIGTPILFPITFEGRKYNYYDSSGRLLQKEMSGFRLPLSTICEFSLDKIDEITPLSGGVGSVKELFGFDDWKINIKGICFRDPKHPQAPDPYEQKRILTEWKMLAEAVDVTGELFISKGINQLYLQSIKISQIPGKPQFIPFEITALSDKAIDLFNAV